MTAVYYHARKFPPKALDWPKLLPLIGPASAAVARYEGVLHGIPNPNVLLSPLTAREAVLSSKIEGTQATLGEVLEFEAAGTPDDESTPKKADIHEVLNYRKALSEATRLMETLPLSQRLIREAHKVLMQGVRGRNKAPGDYRKIPNWIGAEGCTLETARYVPPGADVVPKAMDTLEAYIHADELDKLVQLAIVHAEFEAIHPFLDGNGRLGRLLIPLFMRAKNLLARPNFYMSEYLEEHRSEYYARLLAISRDDDWSGWIEFFMTGLIAQADENTTKAVAILALYNAKKPWAADVTHSQHAVVALDWIFQRPIFKAADFASGTGIPKATASRILRVMKDAGAFKELRPSSGRQSAIYAFAELLNLAEGRKAF